MTQQQSALESVCEKRYNRMTLCGCSDQEAADKVAIYLRAWIEKWGKNESNRHFATALLEGYTLLI